MITEPLGRPQTSEVVLMFVRWSLIIASFDLQERLSAVKSISEVSVYKIITTHKTYNNIYIIIRVLHSL